LTDPDTAFVPVLEGLSGYGRALLAVGAGALCVLAFAPFSLFPLAFLSPAVLFLLWSRGTPLQAFIEGWLFGLGLLGFGVFWVHISIDQFGNVGLPLALFITLLFVAAMALYVGLAGWLAVRVTAGWRRPWQVLLAYCSIWVLGEWLRGWLLGGFPWLALGYSQVGAPLGAWAPLLGVYGVSWMVTLTAASLVLLFVSRRRRRLLSLLVFGVIWAGALLLGQVDWTEPSAAPLDVAIIQGNVPQQDKWQQENLQPSLDLYTGLTRSNWDKDLIIWPETAVPALADRVEQAFLTPLQQEALEHGSSLLLGIPVRESPGDRYYNAMLSLGGNRDAYYKRHLVPFGEFMPLKPVLQPLLHWLRIPMSDFSAGQKARPLLEAAGYPAGISICYEDAFGNEVIEALPDAAFLVNASNDAWFGDSLAPPQHLQIARMRALEAGRYLLRATNTGISALIGPRGELIATAPAFQRHVLSGSILPMEGMTPYARIGNWGVILLSSGLLGLLILSRKLKKSSR
jgi:apolipoprotein N-acyltransferase